MTRFIKDVGDRPPPNVRFKVPGMSTKHYGHIIKGPVDGVVYLVDHKTGGCRTVGSQYVWVLVKGPRGGEKWVKADG